jgi:hypothetical protein
LVPIALQLQMGLSKTPPRRHQDIPRLPPRLHQYPPRTAKSPPKSPQVHSTEPQADPKIEQSGIKQVIRWAHPGLSPSPSRRRESRRFAICVTLLVLLCILRKPHRTVFWGNILVPQCVIVDGATWTGPHPSKSKLVWLITRTGDELQSSR